MYVCKVTAYRDGDQFWHGLFKPGDLNLIARYTAENPAIFGVLREGPDDALRIKLTPYELGEDPMLTRQPETYFDAWTRKGKVVICEVD
jgi:hypothetical protein